MKAVVMVMYLVLALCYLGLAIDRNSTCRGLYILCSFLWFMCAVVNLI